MVDDRDRSGEDTDEHPVVAFGQPPRHERLAAAQLPQLQPPRPAQWQPPPALPPAAQPPLATHAGPPAAAGPTASAGAVAAAAPVAGIGVLAHREWARIIGIVTAVLGTLVGALAVIRVIAEPHPAALVFALALFGGYALALFGLIAGAAQFRRYY